MSNLLPGGLPTLQPRIGLRRLACVGTMQCPLSLCSLPLSLGLSATLGPLFCSQLLCGMPETENLVPGAAPCPPPAVWGQWLNTARCPPRAVWKASASPLTFGCPEHWNSGRMWALSHFPLSYTPIDPPTTNHKDKLKLGTMW